MRIQKLVVLFLFSYAFAAHASLAPERAANATILAALVPTRAFAAGCGSDSDPRFSVQFGWTAEGRLLDAVITKVDDEDPRRENTIVEFDVDRDLQSFMDLGDYVSLKMSDEFGNWVILQVSVDSKRIGKGVISWGIESENVERVFRKATCSF